MSARPNQVALAFESGFSVVPADQNKRPKVQWKAWQTTLQTEDEFASLGHGSVWGLVTGSAYDVVVLDFDFEAGGEATLDALGLREDVSVWTPGGAHVYFTHPGHPVKNAARKWEQYPGLDVRGDGGLAWFAGRSKKGVYTPTDHFLEPTSLDDLDPDLVALFFPHPQETTHRAAEGEWTGSGHGTPEATRYVLRAAKDIVDSPAGGSNAALNKAGYAVGGLIAAGQLDDAWAYDTLHAAAVERGAGDVDVVLEAALATGAESPWAFTPDEDEWIPVAAMKAFSQGGVPDPEPFPIDALPAPLDDFVRQAAKAVSAPVDYIGAGVLPVLGQALGGYVSLEITDSWRESPLLYVALVGPPSSRKSPALGLILAPAVAAQEAVVESARQMADDADDQAWAEVAPPRFIADDATIEAFFGVLERNPRGVILAVDELVGWISGFGQYKGGGGRDRQHWLSIWSRKTIDVQRKTTSSHYIPKPFASVLGGIQPEPLEALMQGRDDGLLPRILMAHGDFVTPVLNRSIKTVDAAARYAGVWDRLRDLGTVERVTKFSDAGYHTFEAWANEHYKSLGKVPPELAGAWGKMDAQCARIALILSAVVGEDEVSPETVDRAASLVRYFQGQAAGLLQGTGSGSQWEKKNAGRTKAIGRYLIDNPGATKGDLMVQFPEWAMDSRNLDRLLEPLTELGVWRG